MFLLHFTKLQTIENEKESDVELGGATVFQSAGITLWPKKRSAVLWYNLHKNGEGDKMTKHAACPVLAGTKWGEYIFRDIYEMLTF